MDRALNASARNSAHAVGLAEWLKRRAARVPYKPALTCDDVTWTYGDLHRPRRSACRRCSRPAASTAGDRASATSASTTRCSLVVMFADVAHRRDLRAAQLPPHRA